MSDGDSGMDTLGPTGEVNGGMVTGLSAADQHMGEYLSLGWVHH